MSVPVARSILASTLLFCACALLVVACHDRTIDEGACVPREDPAIVQDRRDNGLVGPWCELAFTNPHGHPDLMHVCLPRTAAGTCSTCPEAAISQQVKDKLRTQLPEGCNPEDDEIEVGCLRVEDAESDECCFLSTFDCDGITGVQP